MVEGVRNIGAIELSKLKKKGAGLLEVFTEDVSGSGTYRNALEIVIEEQCVGYKYIGIHHKEYDEEDKFKYLYRSGSSRGTNSTPTAKITDVAKTFQNKILPAFKEAIEFGYEKYNSETQMIREMEGVLKDNYDVIYNALDEKVKSIPKKDGSCFLTVVLKKADTFMYVGDFELFRDKLVANAQKGYRYSETYKKDVFKDHACCSICTQETNNIFGLVGIFPFYTIDKPGYISGGFDYEKAWRNYPVCKECIVDLELGKAYLENFLTFSFYGRKYYLIPKPIYGDELEQVLKNYRKLKNDDPIQVREKLTAVEERVMRMLMDNDDSIHFDLVFFEKNNAALNILLNVEDVAPSRFKKIYSTLDAIRRMPFFIEKKVGFELLTIIFPKDTHNRYFLDVLDKIISNNRIAYSFIMRFFVEHILDAFKRYEKDEFIKDVDSFEMATFRVFSFIYYLYKLELLSGKEDDMNMEMGKKEWNLKDYASKEDMFEAFFAEAAPCFASNDRKAVFLTGYLSKKLLNVQYAKEKRKPFISRLKGLKLGRKDIIRLIPEIQAKFSEYKKEYYHEELYILSKYMVASDSLGKIAELDIPYYFSLGMNMDKFFITYDKEAYAEE